MPARLAPVVALILILGGSQAGAQPATLVKDINLTREDFAEPLFVSQNFAALGDTVYFVHNDGLHGYELWKSNGTAAGTVLVKDLCPGACWSHPASLTLFGGELLFIADDGVHGREMWRTNGTAAGTTMVIDLKPGLGNGADTLFPQEDAVYFGGDDGVNGRELWKTDGTAAGTFLVADIRPGAESSEPFVWIEVSGRILVLADDGAHGREPWMSDGTGAGTALLKDVFPGAEGSSVFGNPVSSEISAISLGGGLFLFLADDGVQGLEPWLSDGTEAGTILLKDINPGAPSSSAFGFTRLGDQIVFTANRDSEGFELWSTDGTEAGTALLEDIRPGNLSSAPRAFKLFNGQVYFLASDEAAGRELWRTDGTAEGTALVKDISPGTSSGFPLTLHFRLTEAGPLLLFFADDGVHGVEPWKSDGTEAGTVLVKDIEPGAGFGYVSAAGAASEDGTFFFHAATSAHGIEPWKSNGTAAGTVEIKNVAVLKSSLAWWQGFGAPFQQVAGKLLMEADDGSTGFEPWVSDGSSAGTQRLGDLAPGAAWSIPVNAYSAGATTLLVANQGRLWTTNGTPAGTVSFQPHGLLPGATNFAPALGILFFSGEDSSAGAELWRTDATEGGTQRLFEINPGAGSSSPSDFTDLGSVAVFTAFDGVRRGLWRTASTGSTFALTGASVAEVSQITPLGAAALFVCDVNGSGVELCATDGTLPGTDLLKEIRAGGDSSSPSQLTRAGSRIFFFADDGSTGSELWVSNGSEAGTLPVEDIRSGAESSRGRVLGVLGDLLVFVADDGANGLEPWVSDGTPEGTLLLKDIYTGLASSQIEEAVAAGNRLFFVADDGVHGRELWVTDGTVAGTHLAQDIVPGAGSPVIRNLSAMDHLALFSADDGVHGQEMWRSNGRPAGTFLVQDIAPGTLHSSPGGFKAVGDNLFFAANDNATGFEPWKISRASLLTTFQDVAPAYWAWDFIEALAVEGITTGCAPRQYCPTQTVSRAEMAVFLERGLQGADFIPPPATGTVFTDVPASYWAAAWIEQLAADGITTGCAPNQYCPDALVNRSEMAVFLLRAKHGANYVPPPATGTRFTDVPASYWAAAWIEQLAAEGITTGCAPNQYCPAGSVTRDQMAAFLTRTFALPLP